MEGDWKMRSVRSRLAAKPTSQPSHTTLRYPTTTRWVRGRRGKGRSYQVDDAVCQPQPAGGFD